MANPKPDARTRFRRSTRDGADGSTQRRLTSDRISADLADFQKAGGQVEVLGVTRVLKKLGESAGESADEKADQPRSEEHTSELQSLMRNSYAVFCLKKT